MIVRLPFADDRLAVDLRGLRVRVLRPSAPAAAAAPRCAVANALDHPLQGPGLAELAAGRDSAVIVVPDATRPAQLAEVLPEIFERLRVAGLPNSAITVLVACGTHPAVGRERLRGVLGPVPDGVAVIEQNCHDREALIAVGELRPGLPLTLHRAAVEAALLVTVGGVRHHYFAGFGGGPKMVFPGIAGHAEIQANHALVLEGVGTAAVRRNPHCEPGRLAGNPVAEEIARAASMRPPDLALCLVPAADGGIAHAVAGPWRSAFDEAVEKVRAWFEVPPQGPFPVMVASAGGRPSDTTLIQAHKALDAACRFLEPGGELLFVAGLDGGPGSPAMEPFLADPRPEAILNSLADRWVQYGHTTLRLVEKTTRFRVRLFSRLEDGLVRRLGFEPVEEPQAEVDRWRERASGVTVGVMACGAVYPRT